MPRSTQGNKEALAAVSSLKRALGIPNHPTQRDEFAEDDLKNNICHIYTPDKESAELVGELLYRIAVMPKGAAYYDSIRPRSSVRDTIKVQPLGDSGYEALMYVWNLETFTNSISRIIAKHIAPEKRKDRDR